MDSRPAIWTSVDGTEWIRVPHDSEVFAQHSRIHDVAATALGWVAVGRHSTDLPEDIGGVMFVPESIPVAWVSADGVAWAALDLSAQTEDDCLPGHSSRVVAIGKRVVITGECNGPSRLNVPVVWTTETGTEWTINRFPGKQYGDGFHGVIAVTDSGLLMAGGRVATLMWASPDGTDWQQTSLGPAMWIGDASAHGDTLLVVGVGRSDFEATPNQARVWIGTATPK